MAERLRGRRQPEIVLVLPEAASFRRSVFVTSPLLQISSGADALHKCPGCSRAVLRQTEMVEIEVVELVFV